MVLRSQRRLVGDCFRSHPLWIEWNEEVKHKFLIDPDEVTIHISKELFRVISRLVKDLQGGTSRKRLRYEPINCDLLVMLPG